MAKLKDPYGKGSWILRIAILGLIFVLGYSIMYPRQLWEQEARNLQLGRYRMSQLYNAELQYQRFNTTFTDTMDQLLDFVKTDTNYHHLIDSMVVRPIQKSLNDLDTLRQIQTIADNLINTATDSAVADSVEGLEDRVTARSRDLRNLLEAVRERMLGFPVLPVPTFDQGLEIIERKDYFLKMEVVRRMVAEVGDLKLAQAASQQVLTNIDSIDHHMRRSIRAIRDFPANVDSLRFCPTIGRPYKIALEDSGVFRFVNVRCPIDSEDVQKVEANFLISKVGAFKLENHGSIVRNEKSWEERK